MPGLVLPFSRISGPAPLTFFVACCRPQMKGLLRGCLVTGAVAFLLVLSCAAYIYHPHFPGSSPKSIGVMVYRPASSENAYETNLTNASGCKMIVAGLRHATFSGFGAKADGVSFCGSKPATPRFLSSYHCWLSDQALSFHCQPATSRAETG